MKHRVVHAVAVALAAVLLCPFAGAAQWLTERTGGLPRNPDGTANLTAPAPRAADGKPDLSGLWHAGTKYESDLKPSEVRDWALAQSRAREANPAADSWSVLCLPPGPMITFSGIHRIIQTQGIVAILYDGRTLPTDPNPTWQGYSVGRWDGDTLVVQSNGFNGRSWVGRPGYPHTEALRVTERFRRRDFGHMDVQMTIDDPKTFTRPWTMTTELVFDADTELLEFVCNENEKSRQHFVQPQSTASAEIRVDPAVLATYAGVYRVTTPRGESNATITVEGGQLMADVPGIGSGPMVAQSATTFLFRGAVVEFVANEKGEVTYFIAHVVEGDFKSPRIDKPSRP
jgi:hypothetical protein